MSLPPIPKIVSAPPRPQITSWPAVPWIVSGPAVPVIVQATFGRAGGRAPAVAHPATTNIPALTHTTIERIRRMTSPSCDPIAPR